MVVTGDAYPWAMRVVMGIAGKQGVAVRRVIAGFVAIVVWVARRGCNQGCCVTRVAGKSSPELSAEKYG